MTDEVAELPGEEPEITGEDVNEDSSPQQEDSSAEPEVKEPKGVQKRINELTANWREQERINEELRRQNYDLQKALTKPEVAPEAPPPPQSEPALDQFETYDQYVAALAEYKAETKFQEWQNRQTEAEKQGQVASQEAEFTARAAEFAAENPDYHSVALNPSLPISEPMAEVLRATETGPQLLYHLGKNPNEAARIAQLPPTQAAMELGRLEVRLNTPQPKTQTNAPDPVQPVSGTGGPIGNDPEKMSPEQWLEWRNNQLRPK